MACTTLWEDAVWSGTAVGCLFYCLSGIFFILLVASVVAFQVWIFKFSCILCLLIMYFFVLLTNLVTFISDILLWLHTSFGFFPCPVLLDMVSHLLFLFLSLIIRYGFTLLTGSFPIWISGIVYLFHGFIPCPGL